ncbi:MAG: hypothetical protein U0271_32395 [Polyangiaceae bacterium]
MSPLHRWLLAAPLSLLSLLTASVSHAEGTSASGRRALVAREQGKPHTLVEVGFGVLALPAAEVCIGGPDQCVTGEISIAAGIRNLYQFGPFAVGLSGTFGSTLRNDDAQGAPELEREHSRQYFLVEGLFRWSFVQTNSADAYIGTGLGLVSVRDSWSVAADRDPAAEVKFVGAESLVISTLGLSLFVSAGGEWFFWDNFSLGGSLRYGNWILPFDAKTSAFGDVASLSGRVDFFELQTTLAYRLAL